jgi:hypothetical protein
MPLLPSEMPSLATSMKRYANTYAHVADLHISTILTLCSQVWEKYGIDGIIAPVQAVPQLPHGWVFCGSMRCPKPDLIHMFSEGVIISLL